MFRNILYFYVSFQVIKKCVRSTKPEDFTSIKLGVPYITILHLQEKALINDFNSQALPSNSIFKENEILILSITNLHFLLESLKRLRDSYLKNGVSNDIAYVRKHANFQLYRVHPVTVLWKNQQLKTTV